MGTGTAQLNYGGKLGGTMILDDNGSLVQGCFS